jgi:hypothetical protein
MCWYDPPEADKKNIKRLCEELVCEMKRLARDGDPIGCTPQSVTTLINHLYQGKCDEKHTT